MPKTMTEAAQKEWLKRLRKARADEAKALQTIRNEKKKYHEKRANLYKAWRLAGLHKRRLLAQAIELGMPQATIAEDWGTTRQNVHAISQNTADHGGYEL